MNSHLKCPRCDGPLPPGTPPDECPRCLLRVVLEDRPTEPEDSPPAPAPEELTPLFPQLEIGALLGRGGMGAVYRARQISLDRTVALKILAVDAEADPEFAGRFAREARALASLSHPNIVAVHDFGRAGKHYYLIMEFVDGTDLRRVLQAGEMEPREALAIVGQVCDALQYAHEEGVVHRDIKPENILMDRKGRAKIADFGLAKILGRAPADVTLTGSRQVMGTLHYMAPEQIQDPQGVDHRADIYSLGVVLYELLTGEVPLGRFQPPSRKIQVDLRVDEIVLKALEREPELRYQQASEVRTDLDRVTGSGDADAVKRAAPRPAGGWRPWIFSSSLVLLVALVGLAALLLRPRDRTDVAGRDAGRSSAPERAAGGNGASEAGMAEEDDGTPPNPALVAAASRGFVEGVRVMLEEGADVNARDLMSNTALIKASENGHLPVVNLLLDAGADVNLRGVAGTPLSAASYHGHLAVVRRLLQEHPDLDGAGFLGNTALMLAVDQGHTEVVRALLAAGADPTLRRLGGSSAIDVAAAKGHAEILEMLRNQKR